MSKNKTVQEMIDEVVKPGQQPPPGKNQPAESPKPAELDQDPGGGYNPDHTDPQT